MISSPARILVVDDEESILETVGGVLRDEGYEVETAATGREALSTAIATAPDLIVLDVMLPDFDGLEVTRRLRAEARNVGVLFLTARDTLDDCVAGLRVGGDDYLTKPFSLEEVVARVEAILRRTRRAPDDGELLRVGDLVMDTTSHEVWRNSIAVHLTATEFALLRYFMVNARHVLSKAQILVALWDDDSDVDENVVETYVSYLRKKLDRLGPPLIHTVRLVGYVFRPISG